MPSNVESLMSSGGIIPWWMDQDRTNPYGALGVILDEEKVDLQTALKAGGVDWTVSKEKFAALLNNGNDPLSPSLSQPSEDLWALVRSSDKKILNVVGNDYTVIQPREGAEFALTVMDVSGAHFVTSGSLDGGRIVIFCLALPDETHIAGLPDERINWYVGVKIPFGTNASRSRKFEVVVNGIRWVCTNTMNAGLASAFSGFRVAHTSNATQRIVEARNAIGITFDMIDSFTKELEDFLNTPATEKTMLATINNLWAKPDEDGKALSNWTSRTDQILSVWKTSPNLQDVKNTKYGVYNAMTEWSQWVRNFRGTGSDKTIRDQVRIHEVLVGRSAEIDKATFNFLAKV